MLIALIFIFIAAPALEIYLFVVVGEQIGALATIALTFLAAVVGTAIIRMQAPRAIGRAQDSVKRGEAPVREVLDGVALVAAGGFLILPGFFTDAIGLLLLIPWVRRSLGYALLYRALAPSRKQGAAAGSGIVDGEFTVVDGANERQPPRIPPAP